MNPNLGLHLRGWADYPALPQASRTETLPDTTV